MQALVSVIRLVQLLTCLIRLCKFDVCASSPRHLGMLQLHGNKGEVKKFLYFPSFLLWNSHIQPLSWHTSMTSGCNGTSSCAGPTGMGMGLKATQGASQEQPRDLVAPAEGVQYPALGLSTLLSCTGRGFSPGSSEDGAGRDFTLLQRFITL